MSGDWLDIGVWIGEKWLNENVNIQPIIAKVVQ